MGENLERGNSSPFGGSRSIDRAIAALAARQHGVVSLTQLLELDVHRESVKHRLRVGRLHRLHQGVYAVGHRKLSRAGRWMAATLVTEDVLLSHRSAGELLNLREPTGGGIHITSPIKLVSKGPLIAHRRSIPADERTIIDGIPATSLSRTLLDLAACEGEAALTRALRQAHDRRLTDSVSLPDLLELYPRRRGTAIVRRALSDGAYSLRTRSGLEDRFLEFLAERKLPRPETNALVEVGGERFEVDCLWRSRRVVVELDTYATHGSRETIEADRRRDGLLQAHGLPVHRITDTRLGREPDQVDAQLRRALLDRSERQRPL